jgi:hypothetical protein
MFYAGDPIALSKQLHSVNDANKPTKENQILDLAPQPTSNLTAALRSTVSPVGKRDNAGSLPSTMTLSPTPGFVVKSVDSKGRKVFINVAHDSSIPPHPPIASLLAIKRPPLFAVGPTGQITDKVRGRNHVWSEQ